jgi:hypothetical protein
MNLQTPVASAAALLLLLLLLRLIATDVYCFCYYCSTQATY